MRSNARLRARRSLEVPRAQEPDQHAGTRGVERKATERLSGTELDGWLQLRAKRRIGDTAQLDGCHDNRRALPDDERHVDRTRVRATEQRVYRDARKPQSSVVEDEAGDVAHQRAFHQALACTKDFGDTAHA